MKSILGSLAVVFVMVACGSPVVDFPVDQGVGSGLDGGCHSCSEHEDSGKDSGKDGGVETSDGGIVVDADASLPGCN